MKSNVLKEGIDTLPHRSLLSASGVKKADFGKPFIGIANSFNDIIPGHMHLDKLVDAVKAGIYAAGGIGKNGNVAQNGMALIMLGASAVHIGKYIMQSAAGCLGNEQNRCNVCNVGICPKGITSQSPKLYRRLDPDLVAERVANTYMAIQTEVRKIMAPLGRSQSLPIGMSDALGINDKDAADRLQIKYVC